MQTIAVITSVKNSVIALASNRLAGTIAAEQRGDIRRRAGDDGRQLEADAGQRDDADDDADGCGRRADADRVFGADHEGIEDVEQARLAGLVLHHVPADTAIDCTDDRPEAFPLGQDLEPDAQRDRRHERDRDDRLRLVRPSTMQPVMPQYAAR